MHWLSVSLANWFVAPLMALSALFGFRAQTTPLGPPVATSTATTTLPVACTMEAKLCPDGSSVGRVGPDCHFAACPGSASTPTPAPKPNPSPAPTPTATSAITIYSATPTSGPVGTEVTLDGFGFTGDNTIHFTPTAGGMGGVILHAVGSGGRAIICAQNATNCHSGVHQSLTFTIPATLDPACAFATPRCLLPTHATMSGTYAITVENVNGTSASVPFTVLGPGGSGEANATPVLYSMTPTSGPVGTRVTIAGDHFDGNARVHFGGGFITDVTVVPAVFHCPMQPVGSTATCGNYTETLTFSVPASVGPYCTPGMLCAMYLQEITPGTYPVTVETDVGVSVTKTFVVTK